MNKKGRQPLKESDRQVETVAKALCILDCFSLTEPELSLKRLSEITGLYKSRIIRLCGTLAANGFLIRTPSSGYRLGPKLLILGKIYETSNPLTSVARPIMRRLSDVSGESTKIFVIDGKQRLCLVRELGPSPLHYAINEGERQALYAGAGGKALLAYAPEEFRRKIIHNALEKLTADTIIDPDRIEKDLATIRRQGYAFTRGELVPEVAGLAAPVYQNDDTVCAALTITGPVQHFSDDRVEVMLEQLLEAARELSALMGQREPVHN